MIQSGTGQALGVLMSLRRSVSHCHLVSGIILTFLFSALMMARVHSTYRARPNSCALSHKGYNGQRSSAKRSTQAWVTRIVATRTL